eukprot:GHVH01004718.1.p1 GENE.GHVH01004718.1~~GHVH01004718.1.p1  ORF type:complete len:464 (+),score=69.32 GHVH01004718.1:374-1765(+)
MTNPTRDAREARQAEFETDISAFLKGFFDSGFDSTMLIDFLRRHEDQQDYFDLLIIKIIRKAFDSNEYWVIEAIAGLFVVCVSAGLITKQVISRAFEKLFHIVDDLAMDVPGIYDTVVELICTGIDDRIIPENFLSRTPITVLTALIDEQRKLALAETVEAMRNFRAECKKMFSEDEFWNLGVADSCVELRLLCERLPEGYELKHEVIRPLIVCAMTKSNHTREVVSQILSECTDVREAIFTTEDAVFAFCRIFLHLPDTKLDVPNVQNLLAKFLARAIVDEVVPPSYLQWTQRLHIGSEEGSQVLRLVEDWIDPETRKNLGVKYENIWRGSDPLSEVAMESRMVTRSVVNELYDNDEITLARAVSQIQNNALTPDLATVCVRVIIESILERGLEPRIVAIAVTLLQKLKNEHEIDGSNVRAALEYLNTPDRKAELVKDVGEKAVSHFGDVEAAVSEAKLNED